MTSWQRTASQPETQVSAGLLKPLNFRNAYRISVDLDVRENSAAIACA
jgi:hypothetical protein